MTENARAVGDQPVAPKWDYEGRVVARMAEQDAEITRLREALGNVIDALHDELCYEVGQSAHVLNLVEDGCRLLDGPYMGYVGGWL